MVHASCTRQDRSEEALLYPDPAASWVHQTHATLKETLSDITHLELHTTITCEQEQTYLRAVPAELGWSLSSCAYLVVPTPLKHICDRKQQAAS